MSTSRSTDPIPPAIRVRGARVHNLRHVDIDIPRDRIVVLTGVSGSGKSSLAFDTIFAEGQRRYIEGLSSHARQFLDQQERPDVDQIDGLPPTVSIDQKSGSANPRSTVGTLTEIHDYLRLLYARAGTPHCPQCDGPIERQTPEQIVAGVLAMEQGRKVIILAPIVRARKGRHAEAFAAVRRAQLIRARVDGEIVELGEDPPKLAATKPHTIEAVVDRLVIRDGIRPRLAESVDLALKIGDGTVVLAAQAGAEWQDRTLSIHYACPSCGANIEEIEPRTFSFNSPHGACRTCDGLGSLCQFDSELVVPDQARSLEQSIASAFVGRHLTPDVILADPALDTFLKQRRVQRSTPLASWPRKVLKALFDGDEESGFVGIIPRLNHSWETAKTEGQRAALIALRQDFPCPDCGGARLRPEARAVMVGGKSIQAVCDLAIDDAIPFFESLSFDPPRDLIGPPLVREIRSRLQFLERVGLGYLSLSRGADTLSGGELQRTRLASQIGSGLTGVGFILDEPTSGLHPRDTDRLISTLRELRDRGNTILVVEHDEPTIRASDWVIDLGPGAGPDGGTIVAEGVLADVLAVEASVTARYLRRPATLETASSGRLERSPGAITVVGASARNLKGNDARFPLGCITCVAGVSGSGKSSLVLEVLARAACRTLEGRGPRPGAHARIAGLDAIDKQITIDQSSIGRGPRSTPATYVGLYDEIRLLFARTREAKLRGYRANRFSFNAQAGRCEGCAGQGVRRIETRFLPDLFVRCEACGGKRFNRQTLEVKYKGKSIADVLDSRVDEALEFFGAIPRIHRGVLALHEAGLGYIKLGQSSTTLSGGEAQRVKLAAELGRDSTGKTLYVLDEPTTGLHAADVANLRCVLTRLADLGNTIVIIEHNLDVIRSADWVIDLGPEGGAAGGQVVAMGRPDQIAACPSSQTGTYLKRS
jgi:excinuclease ABC subunit A